MSDINRRQFVETSLITAASIGIGLGASACQTGTSSSAPEGIVVDTNVDLCCWPFRDLKYGSTDDLVTKLREHGIKQAWAGSYDAIFHKDIDGVNRRLTERCNEVSGDFLVPFGTVNPVWPDWREDLRRCDEMYNMPGIKLYPNYQGYGYDLNTPEFKALLQEAAKRDMIVEMAVDMDDDRTKHPRANTDPVDVSPLPDLLQDVPDVTMILVNGFKALGGNRLERLANETDVRFSIDWVEGNGAIELMIKGRHWHEDAQITADRWVFGSHAPFFPVENALLKLMESELTTEQATAIMRGNAEGIYSS